MQMKAVRRIILFVLTLALVMSVIPAGLAVTKDESYALYRTDSPNMQYESLSPVNYTYLGGATYVQPAIYTMSNTENGNVIATYCLDIKVTAWSKKNYNRLNLEDSSYSASAANQIRAILLGGFYLNRAEGASDAEHANAVRAKVAELGEAAGVEDLSLSEAISATQCAIWQVSHGAALTFDDFVRGPYMYSASTSAVQYASLCNEERVKYTINSNKISADDAKDINNRIRTVYNYLLSLEPVGPSSKVVSPSSFVDLHDPVLTENEDGTYNISVDVTVDVQMADGDDLTLKADLKGYEAEQQPSATLNNGRTSVTLTIENIPEENIDGEVTLAISGYQTGNGVFLFDAEGERGSSQTMVGMDNSRLPVYAEVVAQESHVLNITKTTYSGTPLEGIIFDIYPVATLDEYLNGSFTISNPTTRNDLAEYTLITDKNGFASLNFTQHGLKDGVYLVVEREHPDIVAPIDPFYIIFPARYTLGTESDYEISVYPKNELKNVPIPTGGIELLKVDSEDNTLMLSGAEFKVYRTASQEEIAGNAEGLTQIPGISGSVLPVSFYDNQDKSGEKVTSVTTGADGKLSIYGLTFGDYYLVETKAPEGYNLMESPLEFTIDAGSHQGAPVLVENVSGAILPETGGIGTTVFTFGGMILVAFSVLMLLDRKRRHSM